MAKLQSSLILDLVDNVSGPARRIDQNLDNLRRQQQRNQEMFNQHRNAMLGTAAAAYVMARAIATPIQASIEFSTQLEDIRQKADMSAEAIEKLGRAARDIGMETAQGAGSITGAIDSMVGSGAVTHDQATEISTPLGKAATAYGADPTEMANATSAIVLQMGIAAEDMERIYDIMAVGGKLGAFELKNMATEFPGVLANAKSLGMEGEKGIASVVAWLQIARRGTADGATAATNFADFMGKVMSQNAIKNFGEAGVDIVQEMSQAALDGVDPVEKAVGIINGLTEGQRDKLGELFQDKQVTDFLLQATKGIEEYRRIRDEALAADGTVEADFQARLLTPAGAIARFEASIENLNIAIGNSLVPALADFARSVTPMIDGVAAFVDANGELVAAIVEITAALIGLRLLASAGGMAGALLGMGGKGAGVAATVAGGGAAGAGAAVAGVGGVLAAGKNFLGTTFGKMVGGYIVYELAKAKDEWAPTVVPDMSKSWERNTLDQLDPTLAKWIYGEIDPVQNMIEKLSTITPPSLVGTADSEEMAEIRRLLSEAESGVTPLHPIELTALKQELAALEAEAAAAGNAAGLSLQTGFGAQMSAVAAEMQSVMARLRIIAASGVTIPMRVAGPQASPVVTRATIAGARASGGPVKGGSTYEINERGTEYFTPDRAGYIHKAGSFRPPGMPSFGGGGQGGGGVPQSISFGDIILQNPTDASPREISRMLGDEVGKIMRSAHTNGAR